MCYPYQWDNLVSKFRVVLLALVHHPTTIVNTVLKMCSMVKLLCCVFVCTKAVPVFQQGVWETLLSALEILIQDNHWQQTFNIKQLLKAQVAHRFLLTCQVLQVMCHNFCFEIDRSSSSVGKNHVSCNV